MISDSFNESYSGKEESLVFGLKLKFYTCVCIEIDEIGPIHLGEKVISFRHIIMI